VSAGPERRKWLPEGLLGDDLPGYLDGSLPGGTLSLFQIMSGGRCQWNE